MSDQFELIEADHEAEQDEDDEDAPNHGYNLRSSRSATSASSVVQIPQYLARLISMFPTNRVSEDVNLLDTDSSDDDDVGVMSDHFWPIRRPSLPKKPPKPSKSAVESLQATDFYYETSESLGPNLEECQRSNVQHNLLNLLQSREVY